MRNLLLLFSLTLTQLSIGQNANNLYATGDSLYKAKEYKNAAVAFATGIREEGKEASINRYWSLASSWSLAGETDSAFHYLNVITQSNKINKVQATDIENEE